MKKLIFYRDGANICVIMNNTDDERGIYNLNFDINRYGYKNAIKRFKNIDSLWFATTCPTILYSIDWRNEEEQKFEIYIPTKKGKLKNIQEFTDRELRQAHNIEKLFLGGEFDD